jgi:hypothetical protein
MKIIAKATVLIMTYVIFTGCYNSGYKESYTSFTEKNRVNVKYDVKTFNVNENSSLIISDGSGNIEVYGWRENKVKIEINETHTEDLAETNDSAYECYIKDNTVFFDSKNQNKEKTMNKLNLIIYVPRQMSEMKFNLKKNNLTLYDRINTKINAVLDDGGMVIKGLEGEINADIKNGDITFESVNLKDVSNVITEKGNISFKGSIVSDKISIFETKSGNINFGVYSSKTAPFFECDGDVEVNSLQVQKNPSYDKKVILRCDGGHIDLSEIY